MIAPIAVTGCDIALPYPPTNNRYYRNIRGKTLISEAGRQYKQRVWLAFRKALPGFQKLAGRLTVEVYATMPDRRRRDLDGIPKALLDSLTGLAWADDEQIDKLTIERVKVCKPGMVFVQVKTVGDGRAWGVTESGQ